MNDKELADRVVALGVGKANQIYPDGIGKFYQVDVDADWQTSVNESKFVRDWRVAGSLMDRMSGKDLLAVMDKILNAIPGPLPRAIISACCEALTNE